jgi:hypothetical protein
LGAPLPLQHQRQPVDHHIEETADQQPEQAGDRGKRTKTI